MKINGHEIKVIPLVNAEMSVDKIKRVIYETGPENIWCLTHGNYRPAFIEDALTYTACHMVFKKPQHKFMLCAKLFELPIIRACVLIDIRKYPEIKKVLDNYTVNDYH